MTEIRAIRAEQPAAEDDSTLPHSTEAEQQLLGALLTNNDSYDKVSLIIGPQHFYDPVHARIYDLARLAGSAISSCAARD